MSEYSDYPEFTPHDPQLNEAGDYLRERLDTVGSFSSFALALQGEYEQENRGQVYQLYRASKLLTRQGDIATAEQEEQGKAVYAGALAGMAVVDFMTGRENSIPASMLANFSRDIDEKWGEILDEKLANLHDAGEYEKLLTLSPFPSSEERFALHGEVAAKTMRDVLAFSDNTNPAHGEARAVLENLLYDQTIPIEKVLLIQVGYWAVLREWLNPAYSTLEETLKITKDAASRLQPKTRESLVDAAKALVLSDQPIADLFAPKENRRTTTMDDDIIAELERQLENDPFEADLSEWNRQSLNDMARKTVFQALRLRAPASIGHDTTDAASAAKTRRSMSSQLTQFVRNEFELDEEDLLYAYGTFIAFGKGAEGQFSYQNITPEDEAAMSGESHAHFTDIEVRGTFDKIVVEAAPLDRDSYTFDLDKDPTLKDLPLAPFTPAVRLLNVSIFDMTHNREIERIQEMSIPLTHSHLMLGRFVPPSPEVD